MQLPDASQAARAGEEPDSQECGLNFDVARSIDDVLDAWGLVYDAYVRAGLIRKNRWGLHTVSEAVQPQTLVTLGRIRDEPASTMSCYLDGPQGLALDRIYSDRLRELREVGGVMEVGLFADRRRQVARSINALLELMRFTFYYAVHAEVRNILIGVNPHHAKFYERIFGFVRFAEDSTCPAVNDAPLVPLRLDIPATYHQPGRLPKGLAFFRDHPVAPSTFDGRFTFDEAQLAGTRIADYLAGQQAVADGRMTAGR